MRFYAEDMMMEVTRRDDGAAILYLDHGEVRELLGAFALSMAAYGLLQNFMLPHQKAMALPSIVFISRVGALLAKDETFDVASDAGQSAQNPYTDAE
jgi:hypothetical protein